MTDLPNNETRTRLLEVADDLFSKRGYTGVRLRDIANAMGMKHASLYYYAPGGKQQLFIEVMERNFHRHRDGITAAIAETKGDLRQRMYAVAHWLISQPPLDMSRMAQSDMKEIDPAAADRLMEMAFDSFSIPIRAVLEEEKQAGKISILDPELAAIAFVSLILSAHNIPNNFGQKVRQEVAKKLVDMLLDGWLTR